MADILKLNVGGHFFTTTKATLLRYPNSMLGVMFNGSFSTTVDSNGYYFIDRDGTLFPYILNFLRSSALCLPEDFKHLDQLSLEADFYQIQPLITALENLRKARDRSKCQTGKLLEVIEVRTGSTATMPTNNSRVKTIISGRRNIVCNLPFVNAQEKLQHTSEAEFIEIELSGTNSNIRLKLGEYLQNSGWKLLNCDVSSSSGYDTKSMISSLLIEHTYRDRWLCPDQEYDCNGV